MQLSLLVVAIVGTIYGKSVYRDEIPNGYKVPNMCYGTDGGPIWAPVGHYSPTNYTQDKNLFGKDFAAANHTWTRSLCLKDSDGDGKTNGDELGDPHCRWIKGGDAPDHNATGHPGICEPLGSNICSNQAFFCGCHGHACVLSP
ncbi:hypothetical protein ACJMK2_038054 [Sinanodonta woodiana]|uniref:Temptin Cys/Cys disulfide domain-containing protein n=1 Tax=Sinanodonta woodiana TaxID=1069815 RepID=A0ABD3WMB7_SINWO